MKASFARRNRGSRDDELPATGAVEFADPAVPNDRRPAATAQHQPSVAPAFVLFVEALGDDGPLFRSLLPAHKITSQPLIV